MNSSLSAAVKDLLNFKTGWKTSEFWVALSPVVVVLLHVFGVSIGPSETNTFIMVAWGAVSSVYVAARTWLKAIHVKHGLTAASILQNLETDAVDFVENKPVPGLQETPVTQTGIIPNQVGYTQGPIQ